MAWTAPKDWGAEKLLSTDMDTYISDNLNFLKSNIALGAPAELTISGGVVTKTKGYHTIDTESDAATDDLDTINGGSEGNIIIIKAEHTDRTIVLKDGTGNLDLRGYDIDLTATDQFIALVYDGTNWNLLSTNGVYWFVQFLCAHAVVAGASGATWTAPDANTLGGYRLNASTEYLYFGASLASNWEGSSDIEVKVNWECNVDNTGGADADTVDLKLVCYYKDHAGTVNKTQTLEEAVTVGKSAQYQRWTTTFTINWDETDNVVVVGDKMSMILSLETDTSEVDDVVINFLNFRYKCRTPEILI